jgi:hypothetical protein
MKGKNKMKIINNRPKQRYIAKPQTKNYIEQDIKLDDVPLTFPPGLENVFLTIYIILLPYVAGILFYLFYLGENTTMVFSNIPFIITWAIGYEVLASVILLYIFKKAIFFNYK